MGKDLLNPTRQIFGVIGAVCVKPSLSVGDNFIKKEDVETSFHKVVVVAINSIIQNNTDLKRIEPLDIDNYLKNYPKYYDIWSKYNGIDLISDAISVGKPSMYAHDISIIKKYALLRSLINQGIDIKDLFDYESPDISVQTDGANTIESMDMKDIVDHYTTKLIDIRNSVNDASDSMVKFDIKDDIDTLLDRLAENPVMGYPFKNGYYNTLFKGAREGKFMLRSGDSGTGKTRQAISDVCNIACDEIYVQGHGFQGTGPKLPTLFVSTELNKDELQVIVLACISGVSSGDIELGNYDEQTLKRLKRAIEIIKRSEMKFVYIDDFSIVDVETVIKEHVIRYNTNYVSFDYIQNVAKLSRSVQDAYGLGLREDQILLNLGKRLKDLAEELNIFIESSTQVNGKSKEDDPNVSRTSNVIRGGRALADKVDYGLVTFKPTEKDLKKLKPIIDGGHGTPNFSHWVYKNRAGLSEVIIWTKMNLGNMREIPLFVTDYNYNLLEDVTETKIVAENNSEEVVI